MYTNNLDHIQIDDSLYNRQRYVLGDDAMKTLFQTRVFLYGLNGLGVEIAKNLVLSGVKELVICDDNLVTISDIGTQFFLRESDVGMNRAHCTCPRLAELNSYVSVSVFGGLIADELSILEEFTCVIFVNCLSLKLLELANQHCRKAKVPFISASIFGVFASIFNDFGDTFEIFDQNGEEKREFMIEHVYRNERGVVRVRDSHDLEPGDRVTFHNVRGMVELNNGEYDVIEVSRKIFRIRDTSSFSDYELDSYCVGCGIKKKPINVSFESISTQLHNPKFMSDVGRPIALKQNHLAYITMLQFVAKEGRMPQPYNQSDFELMIRISEDTPYMLDLLDKPDYDVIGDIANTGIGCLQPLCATLGGIVAQEALIALTNTFTPIQQWLHFDAREVIPRYEFTPGEFTTREDRYDSLRICIGETNLQRLMGVNSFMVGCGAIGCEILKNIALMGVSRKGKFIVTDNDIVERTNLNNQFLFRERDIKQPKSTTACNSAVEINPQVNIEAHQNKVGNKDHCYTDQFIQNQDFVINAVDNIETRQYSDARCINNLRPLLESGVMGAKGHVQVIIPFQTETYYSNNFETEPAHCSLPLKKTYCVDWMCRRFDSMFMNKPRIYSDFWSTTNPLELLSKIQRGEIPEHSTTAVRLLANGVYSFEDCVRVARIKFDKYFKHVPTFANHSTYPIDFNSSESHHIGFVTSCAKLLAFRSGIHVTEEECKIENVVLLLEKMKITTHRKKRRSDFETSQITMDYLTRVTNSKMSLITNNCFTMQTNTLNADDVTHIDFMTTACNLLAENYLGLPLDRWYVKKTIGRIIPAIVTTSSVVSGLVTIELIKLVEKCPVEQHMNCSISLAASILQFSEPGTVNRIEIRPGEFFTAWDKWEINGNDDMTLGQFINVVFEEYNVDLSLIAQGTKLIYISYIPSHTVRLNKLMSHTIVMTDTESYVDLVGSSDECEDIPMIRYYWA